MQFNIDKRFIEILNEQGCPITWDKFRAAYDVRKAERDADPVVIARKMRREALADRQFAMLQELISQSSHA